MTLRRRLPLCVAAWLVFQLTSLSVFIPRNCCTAHQITTDEELGDCHRTAADAATYCPMRAADGTPCPMHRQAPPAQAPAGDCTMSNACNAPAVSMSALLWEQGVLTALVETPSESTVGRLVTLAQTNLVSRLTAPETPPPRA